MSIFVRNFSGPILTVYIIAPILGGWIHSPREPDTSFLAATKVPNNRIFLHSSEVSFFVGNPSIFFLLKLTTNTTQPYFVRDTIAKENVTVWVFGHHFHLTSKEYARTLV